MEKTKAIELINNQIDKIAELRSRPASSSLFDGWKRHTEVIIEQIFGIDSRNISDFQSVNYRNAFLGEINYNNSFLRGLNSAKEILNSMIQEIQSFQETPTNELKDVDSIRIVENICNRFHLVARQIEKRHGNQSTIIVKNEYDVQDLLHALLKVNFDDVRSEECTPSYAGGASRMDFLIKQEKIVIEVKMTRKGLGAKEVGDQLAIDIQRYQAHPDCETLICFVYDPDSRVVNPVGIENDLNRKTELLKVITIITPK